MSTAKVPDKYFKCIDYSQYKELVLSGKLLL